MQVRSLGLLMEMLRKRKGWTQQTLAELVDASSASTVSDWEHDKRMPSARSLKRLQQHLVDLGDTEIEDLWRHLVDRSLVPEGDLVGVLRTLSTLGALQVEPLDTYRGIGTPPGSDVRFHVGSRVAVHLDLPWPGFATVLNIDLADVRAPAIWCIDAMLGLQAILPAGLQMLPRDGRGIPVEEPAGPSCIVLMACAESRSGFSWRGKDVAAVAVDHAALRRQIQSMPHLIEDGKALVCCVDYETVR